MTAVFLTYREVAQLGPRGCCDSIEHFLLTRGIRGIRHEHGADDRLHTLYPEEISLKPCSEICGLGTSRSHRNVEPGDNNDTDAESRNRRVMHRATLRVSVPSCKAASATQSAEAISATSF